VGFRRAAAGIDGAGGRRPPTQKVSPIVTGSAPNFSQNFVGSGAEEAETIATHEGGRGARLGPAPRLPARTHRPPPLRSAVASNADRDRSRHRRGGDQRDGARSSHGPIVNGGWHCRFAVGRSQGAAVSHHRPRHRVVDAHAPAPGERLRDDRKARVGGWHRDQTRVITVSARPGSPHISRMAGRWRRRRRWRTMPARARRSSTTEGARNSASTRWSGSGCDRYAGLSTIRRCVAAARKP
jgi:hypothetical protein